MASKRGADRDQPWLNKEGLCPDCAAKYTGLSEKLAFTAQHERDAVTKEFAARNKTLIPLYGREAAEADALGGPELWERFKAVVKREKLSSTRR